MQFDEWGQQQIPYQPPATYAPPVPYMNHDQYNNTLPAQTYNQFY